MYFMTILIWFEKLVRLLAGSVMARKLIVYNIFEHFVQLHRNEIAGVLDSRDILFELS